MTAHEDGGHPESPLHYYDQRFNELHRDHVAHTRASQDGLRSSRS